MDNKNYLIKKLNIKSDELISYGTDKFKVKLSLLERLKDKKNGKLILVTSINPTKAGEGKTTISIGLAQGLDKINKNVILALREPSLGPVFGQKGGATGGGQSRLEPSWDIDLHFTGDIHALTSANNLLSALIDHHIYFGNELKIKKVLWLRALDINDRSLRVVETKTRTDKFIISAASELMAILALASSFDDLKNRIANIIIGLDEVDNFVYVKDLGVTDSIALLLKDAIKPNLVLSNEGVPAFVHAGPFANIAHGCSSVIATKMALKLADYVITEAGFGADLGMEKFLHIKRAILKSDVSLVVVVTTIKALKAHGNDENNIKALSEGICNLEKHLENVSKFGLKAVVALNYVDTDTTEELEWFDNWAKQNNVLYEVAKGYQLGGAGMTKLANLVVSQANEKSSFKPLYDNSSDIITKINAIIKEVYGASNLILSRKASNKLKRYEEYKYPICIAKTPHSLTLDPLIKGRPSNFNIEISDLALSNGAKIIVALSKGINIMPGLNKYPRAITIKVDSEGEVIDS